MNAPSAGPSNLPQEPLCVELGGKPSTEMQSTLRQIDRREWWLWFSSALVMLLLMLGIASFAFSPLLSEANSSYSLFMNRAVRGLFVLVLMFIGYALNQQIQINHIRRQLMAQVFAVDKVEILAQEVYNMAVLDPVTGIYNRRYAEQRLTGEIARSLRHQLPLTVILIDLDDFKKINDQFGHPTGDSFLRGFAERLSRSTRGSDVVARYGGDEFLAILPNCKPEEVQYVLKRLDGVKIDVNGEIFCVSCSAGWANYVPGETGEELMKRADADLYANKRASKVPVT